MTKTVYDRGQVEQARDAVEQAARRRRGEIDREAGELLKRIEELPLSPMRRRAGAMRAEAAQRPGRVPEKEAHLAIAQDWLRSVEREIEEEQIEARFDRLGADARAEFAREDARAVALLGRVERIKAETLEACRARTLAWLDAREQDQPATASSDAPERMAPREACAEDDAEADPYSPADRDDAPAVRTGSPSSDLAGGPIPAAVRARVIALFASRGITPTEEQIDQAARRLQQK